MPDKKPDTERHGGPGSSGQNRQQPEKDDESERQPGRDGKGRGEG